MGYICNTDCTVDNQFYRPGEPCSVVPPISRKYFDIKGEEKAQNKKDIGDIQNALRARKVKFNEGAHISDLAKLLAKDNRAKKLPLDQLSLAVKGESKKKPSPDKKDPKDEL